MRVDLVVVSHESSAHLARCLRGLREYETVCVVDNDSTDSSAEIAVERSARASSPTT